MQSSKIGHFKLFSLLCYQLIKQYLLVIVFFHIISIRKKERRVFLKFRYLIDCFYGGLDILFLNIRIPISILNDLFNTNVWSCSLWLLYEKEIVEYFWILWFWYYLLIFIKIITAWDLLWINNYSPFIFMIMGKSMS